MEFDRPTALRQTERYPDLSTLDPAAPRGDGRGPIVAGDLTFSGTSTLSRAEQALDFLSNVPGSAAGPSVIIQGLEGTILLWNEGAHQLYGYEAEETVGRVKASLLHIPDDVAAGQPGEIRETAVRDGKWEGTIMQLHKEGKRFTARVVVTPHRDGQGHAVGYLMISKDISDEIRHGEEMRQVRVWLAEQAAIFDLAQAMVRCLDGRILSWSKGAERFYGFSSEEAVGRFSHELFQTVFPQPLPEINEILLRTGFWKGELVHVLSDGREKVLVSTWMLQRDAGGHPARVVEIENDITERRQTEDKIKANLHELQRWRNVTLDREDRIRVLKREVNTLLIRHGQPPRYASEMAPVKKAPET